MKKDALTTLSQAIDLYEAPSEVRPGIEKIQSKENTEPISADGIAEDFFQQLINYNSEVVAPAP
ncbi:MAG: hypothetical protein ABEK29_11010 [Bradymonadaceae bacterium]